MMFQAVDQLQRGLTDAMFATLAGDADVSRLMTKAGMDTAQCGAGTVAALIPSGELRSSWLELQNKLEAFNLFAYVDLVLDFPRSATCLREFVEQASRLDPYRSVWAMEGVGHFFAEMCNQLGTLADLKRHSGSISHSSLVPLHAGAGLSFANHCLQAIASHRTEAEVRDELKRFVAVCEENSYDGYVGAALEALGLATRNLYPQMLSQIDRHLVCLGEELTGYFWHGVGRGVYFAPTNVVTDMTGSARSLDQVKRQPPHELARVNAQSGFIWALVLVNIRHPEIIGGFIRKNSNELEAELVENAVGAAAVIWHSSSPGDKSLASLCDHIPADQKTAALWQAMIGRPCVQAVKDYYPILRTAGIGRLFCHQSLSALVAVEESLECQKESMKQA